MSAGGRRSSLKLANEDRNLNAYMIDSTLDHLMNQSSNKCYTPWPPFALLKQHELYRPPVLQANYDQEGKTVQSFMAKAF